MKSFGTAVSNNAIKDTISLLYEDLFGRMLLHKALLNIIFMGKL